MVIESIKAINISSRLKWALTGLLVFLLIDAVCLILYSRKIEPLVATRIKETILTSTNNLYSIRFSKIRLNPFTGTVRLDNIRFSYNKNVYQQMRKKGIHPTHLYTISVKSLALKHVHPIKVYFKQNLDVNTLHIENPTVKVYYQYPRSGKAEAADKRTTWQRLSKYLKVIKVEHIVLDNIDFQYIDQSLNKRVIDGVKNLSIRIDDLLVDSLSEKDKSRFYFTKEIFVQVKKHEYISRDNLYTILFDDLKISSSKRYARVKGLQVIPRYSELEFSKHLPARKARYTLKLYEALLTKIDFKRLVEKRQLRASVLRLANADAHIFMDKAKATPEFDRGKSFPQLTLKRMRLNTVIDTVKIFNSGLHYSEYTPITARAGKIFFSKLNATVYNFTNNSVTLKRNKWMVADIHSMLYGKGRFNFNIRFNLTSPNQFHTYSASLGPMSAKSFNQVSRPLALLRINSGRVLKADFKVKADYRTSTGTLNIYYTDLNIGLLRIDKQKIMHKQMLMSLVTNNLLLLQANPSKGEKLRIGKISYTRPDSVAFFGTLWQSLYSGLKGTMGLSAERERNLKMQFQHDPGRDKRRELRRGKRIIRRDKRQVIKE